MVNDWISDALTRIRNAQRAGHKVVAIPASRMVQSLIEVLKHEGFIESFEREAGDDGFDKITVYLKYFSNGEPVIRQARRMSSPGRRLYSPVDTLPRVKSSLGISIVSTSQGVMSDREARKRGIGGEVLAIVG